MLALHVFICSIYPSSFPTSQFPTHFCLYVCLSCENMKQTIVSGLVLLFLVFLISSSHLSARLIADKQGKEEVELTQITDMEETEVMNQLYGVEACDTGDAECFKRRMISEAHLDYIYTQHHKP